MAAPPRPAKGRKRTRRGPGQQIIGGKDFRLADEVRYIQRHAANHHGRIVTIGQLLLFSTETGDAWLLDPADRLAARLARDGESEPIHIEETDTTFAIGWKGRYRIEGAAFVYSDNDSGPGDYDPRLPDRSARGDRLIRKFQISLVRLLSGSREKRDGWRQGKIRAHSSKSRRS